MPYVVRERMTEPEAKMLARACTEKVGGLYTALNSTGAKRGWMVIEGDMKPEESEVKE